MKRSGIFITLDGIDGSGKSTHTRLLAVHLRRRGYRVVTTREPGGTKAGEAIRKMLLCSDFIPLSPMAELALMYAARAQHIEEVIRPGLASGKVVLSDRYNDASMAYQGCGRRLGGAAVRAFDRIVCRDLRPDLTFLLDLNPKVALQRAKRRRSGRSRFESEGLQFLKRVRAGYHEIARTEPRRVILVHADLPVDEVQEKIRTRVDEFLAQARRRSPDPAQDGRR